MVTNWSANLSLWILSVDHINRPSLLAYNGFLHPTILKASLVHRGTWVCLSSSYEVAGFVKFQLQSKLEVVTGLG